MATIRGSVGSSGRNDAGDVKIVQRLLNNRTGSGANSLSVDGICGKKTINSIRRFQYKVVGMKNPDGRVDPGGKTFRALDKRKEATQGRSASPPAGRPTMPTAQSRKVDRQKRREFVRPAVRENSKTSRIIDYIQPHFEGVKATVISGYLNDSDLFWKVNYHWEYLLYMVAHSIGLTDNQKHKRELRAMSSSLKSEPPDPNTGYRTSKELSLPADKSSMSSMDRRYKIVRQSKRDFKRLTVVAKLKSKSKRSPKSFDLAAAPLAHPGKSKHKTGYALDIGGDIPRIKAISKKLGATLVFDEKSHVHVEFKNGVPDTA